MNIAIKSALGAALLTVLGAGAVFAAESCCCKDEAGKMVCCDKEKAGSQDPAPEHHH